MTHSVGQGDVFQLALLSYATQQQAPSTHVATTCKCTREPQLVMKIRSENVEILCGCDAAKQDHFAFAGNASRQILDTSYEGVMKPSFRRTDLNRRKIA